MSRGFTLVEVLVAVVVLSVTAMITQGVFSNTVKQQTRTKQQVRARALLSNFLEYHKYYVVADEPEFDFSEVPVAEGELLVSIDKVSRDTLSQYVVSVYDTLEPARPFLTVTALLDSGFVQSGGWE